MYTSGTWDSCYSNKWVWLIVCLVYLPKSDSEGYTMNESIDLKNTEKEESEMFKHVSKKIPEKTNIRSKIRNRKT